jgi:hypothetical protein
MWVRRIQAEDIVGRLVNQVPAPRTTSSRGVEQVR